MNNITASHVDPLHSFLAEAARQRSVDSGPRLIFAVDATASRKPTWDLACELQSGMFKAAAAVGGLAVQLVYFRGADTFHASPFVSNAAALTKIMAEVFCSSGPTQIRKVLHHAQREASRNRIAALIYVGDTTEEEHSLLRRAAQGLAPFGTKAFVFHENPDENADAVGVFREIARITGGVYLPFDRSSAGRACRAARCDRRLCRRRHEGARKQQHRGGAIAARTSSLGSVTHGQARRAVVRALRAQGRNLLRPPVAALARLSLGRIQDRATRPGRQQTGRRRRSADGDCGPGQARRLAGLWRALVARCPDEQASPRIRASPA